MRIQQKPCSCQTGTTCCGSGKMYETGSWIAGQKETPAGSVPLVSTQLSYSDRFGSWKARWGIRRMRYFIAPGLYGVGNPNTDSPVFVTANYKMTFDRLRKECDGLDAWILVVDTKGINVWCAAGKGTFSAEEITRRIKITRLVEIVTHKKLIIPQLAAPGVAAHLVKVPSLRNSTYSTG